MTLKYETERKKYSKLETKRPSNYPNFRRSLHKDFDDLTITDLKLLKELMQYKGYRLTGKNFNTMSPPSQKQIDFAWSEIKQEYFNFYQYEKHKVYTATRNIEYNGKQYRKGQFLPHSIGR